MNPYMLLFLGVCMVIGLWAPTQKRLNRIIVALTVCLIVFFVLFPGKL
jgi:hypothetical protein